MKKYTRFGALLLLVVFVGVLVSQLFIRQTQAAGLTSSKITISDSRAGKPSVGHTFNVTTGTTGAIKTVLIEYLTTAAGPTVPTGLITTSATKGSIIGLGTNTDSVTSNGTITITVTSAVSIPAGTAITIPYTAITNPTTVDTTSFVRITTKDGSAVEIDRATVAFAVLSTTSVAMTADVDPTFTFSLAAVSSGGAVNAASTNITTTASTIPFGTIAAGTPKIGAIDTVVTTNALLGYKITITATGSAPLTDGGKKFDPFTGTNAAPTAWSAPAGATANTNTGFVGYTTNESALSIATVDRFTSSGGNKWAGLSNTTDEVVYSPVGGAARTIRIGFQAAINALQPPGAYSGTVLVVATPTY